MEHQFFLVFSDLNPSNHVSHELYFSSFEGDNVINIQFFIRFGILINVQNCPAFMQRLSYVQLSRVNVIYRMSYNVHARFIYYVTRIQSLLVRDFQLTTPSLTINEPVQGGKFQGILVSISHVLCAFNSPPSPFPSPIISLAIAVFQSIKAKKFLGLFQQHLVSLCIFPYRTDRSTRRKPK